jgi:Lipocalin-like domain
VSECTNPAGIASFCAGERYIFTVMWSDRAKYSSNALWQGTAEENKATTDGTITYFSLYSAREEDKRIAIHIDASSFPNWNGANQNALAFVGTQRSKIAAENDRQWLRTPNQIVPYYESVMVGHCLEGGPRMAEAVMSR